MAGSVAAGAGGASDYLARYRGHVVVSLRSNTYYRKGTLGGEMTVCEDHLEFRGAGFRRWELRRHEISRDRVESIESWTIGNPGPRPMLVSLRFGIRVISKPGGAFGDRDKYSFSFGSPELDEVLGTLRAAGYPVPAPGH